MTLGGCPAQAPVPAPNDCSLPEVYPELVNIVISTLPDWYIQSYNQILLLFSAHTLPARVPLSGYNQILQFVYFTSYYFER